MTIMEQMKRSALILDRFQKAILEDFFSIDPLLIDEQRSHVRQDISPNYVEIFLSSGNDQCCPVGIALGIGARAHFVHFFYDHSNTIIEDRIETQSEFKDMKEAIREHLESEVIEESTFVQGELVRVKHTWYSTFEGKRQLASFKTHKRILWPWERRQSVIKTYQPWLRTSP